MLIEIWFATWCTAVVFSVLGYYAKNNLAFPVIAGIAWIILGMNTSNITLLGTDSGGHGVPYNIQAGDPDPEAMGLLGLVYLFWVIGIGFILLTGGWMLSGQGKVGDEI